jgi:hypothetical protein
VQRDLIRAEPDGQRLVVTMGDTGYRAVFYKHPDEPRLVAAKSMAVDKDAPLYHKEFERLAWEAANAKARELGWIANDETLSTLG